MKRFVLLIVALVVAANLCSFASDKTVEPTKNAFKTKTKSVAIFKDGYGFFLREGKAALVDYWCMTDYIPKAIAGTFWLYTLERGTVVDTVRSTGKNNIKFDKPADLAAPLARSVGLQISLTTDDGTVEGELLKVVDDMALIKSGKQVNVIKLSDIKSAKVQGQPMLIQVKGGKPDAEVTMRMGYLQQGINWMPSYTLDLVSSTEAKLTLRATITNGVEDLTDCTVLLVVGVPNFLMKPQFDPLTVHSLGTAVLGALPPSIAAPSMSNAQIAERARVVMDGDYGGEDIPTVNVPAEGVQDLYFYEKKGLDMAAGDVVMTSIMEGTLSYRSLFTWDADIGKDVFHYVVLKNGLSAPLTTGPMMVIQGGKVLGQDQLKYVPIGAEGRLKLTQATDIRTERTEKELERDKREVIDGITYLLAVTEGQLVIENRRGEVSEVEVTWSVDGKVLESSDGAQVSSSAKPDQGLNPKSGLKVSVKVDSNSKKTITYKYSRYVRARA